MLYPVADFIACLAPTEFNMLYAVLAHWYSLEFYITKEEFDTQWFLLTGDLTSPRRVAFQEEYHLHSDVIVDGEEEIPIWRFGVFFWALIANYNDVHGWTPTIPCQCQLHPP